MSYYRALIKLVDNNCDNVFFFVYQFSIKLLKKRSKQIIKQANWIRYIFYKGCIQMGEGWSETCGAHGNRQLLSMNDFKNIIYIGYIFNKAILNLIYMGIQNKLL